MTGIRHEKWPVEAESFRGDVLSILYQNDVVKEFLTTEGKFIIVGQKGIGKTILLRAKRETYFSLPKEQRNSFVIIPKNVELDALSNLRPMDKSWEVLGREDTWRHLWKTAISASIISHFLNTHEDFSLEGIETEKKQIQKKLEAFMDSLSRQQGYKKYYHIANQVIMLTLKTNINPSSVLSVIVNQAFPSFYKSGILSLLSNQLYSILLENIRSGCVIFIDQVDKAWEDLMYQEMYHHNLNTLQNIWYSCQIGLVKATRDIVSRNPHIRIYTAIRQEVLGKMQNDPNFIRYEDYFVTIQYSKEDLKKIFKRYIVAFEEKSNLVKPEKINDPILAFVGISKIQNEELFDYIYRHTIQRPRDIIYIGKKISGIPPGRREHSVIKRVILEKAKANLYIDYLKDVERFFSIDFDILFSLIPKNILFLRDMYQICNEYYIRKGMPANSSSRPSLEIFTILYNIGLLGIVKNEDGQHIQYFLEPHLRSVLMKNPLPKSSIYLIHPALYPIIKEKRESEDHIFFINHDIIVGHEYPLKWIHLDINEEEIPAPSDTIKDDEDNIIIHAIERAIELSKKSISKSNSISPKVGAVLVKGNKIICEAYRGELGDGAHAEYCLLEKCKRQGVDPSGGILVVTLEPCVHRSATHTPCAMRIVENKIKKVIFGMLDPNPEIRGMGYLFLMSRNIDVEIFPSKYQKMVKDINKEFIHYYLKQYKLSIEPK